MQQQQQPQHSLSEQQQHHELRPRRILPRPRRPHPPPPPPLSAAALAHLEQAGAGAAFHTRRDLVNFKKICLHLQDGGTHTCKDLKQLCAFFRTDTQSHESFFMPVDRYGNLTLNP